MKRPLFFFFQGSTPTLAFALPYTPEEADVIYATFSQAGKTVTEYTRNGVAMTPPPTGTLSLDPARPSVILISMTQEDTLLFAPDNCEVQLRVLKSGGRADTLFPVLGRVGKAQKKEVIE